MKVKLSEKVYLKWYDSKYTIISNQVTNSVYVFTSEFKIIWDEMRKKEAFDYKIFCNMGYTLESSNYIVSCLLKLGVLSNIDDSFIIDETVVSKFDQYNSMINLYEYNNNLFNILFELTNDCNLKCIHCYFDKSEKISYIEKKDFIKISEEINKINPISITLTGGEMMLNENWEDYYNYFYNNGYIISILSNLTKLKERNVLTLVKNKPKVVQTSIYGNEEIHDKITGVSGSYKKTINSIKLLKKLGVNVAINTVVNKINYVCIDEVSNIAKELNVPVNFDYKIYPKRNGNNELQKALIYSNEINNMNREIEYGICTALKGKLRISSKGILYPCEYINQPLGSLLRNDILELLNGKNAEIIRNIIESYNPEECAYCDKKMFCEIKCPSYYINSLNIELNLNNENQNFCPDPILCRLVKGDKNV